MATTETLDREALRVLAGLPCPRCGDIGLLPVTNQFNTTYVACTCAIGHRVVQPVRYA